MPGPTPEERSDEATRLAVRIAADRPRTRPKSEPGPANGPDAGAAPARPHVAEVPRADEAAPPAGEPEAPFEPRDEAKTPRFEPEDAPPPATGSSPRTTADADDPAARLARRLSGGSRRASKPRIHTVPGGDLSARPDSGERRAVDEAAGDEAAGLTAVPAAGSSDPQPMAPRSTPRATAPRSTGDAPDAAEGAQGRPRRVTAQRAEPSVTRRGAATAVAGTAAAGAAAGTAARSAGAATSKQLTGDDFVFTRRPATAPAQDAPAHAPVRELPPEQLGLPQPRRRAITVARLTTVVAAGVFVGVLVTQFVSTEDLTGSPDTGTTTGVASDGGTDPQADAGSATTDGAMAPEVGIEPREMQGAPDDGRDVAGLAPAPDTPAVDGAAPSGPETPAAGIAPDRSIAPRARPARMAEDGTAAPAGTAADATPGNAEAGTGTEAAAVVAEAAPSVTDSVGGRAAPDGDVASLAAPASPVEDAPSRPQPQGLGAAGADAPVAAAVEPLPQLPEPAAPGIVEQAMLPPEGATTLDGTLPSGGASAPGARVPGGLASGGEDAAPAPATAATAPGVGSAAPSQGEAWSPVLVEEALAALFDDPLAATDRPAGVPAPSGASLDLDVAAPPAPLPARPETADPSVDELAAALAAIAPEASPEPLPRPDFGVAAPAPAAVLATAIVHAPASVPDDRVATAIDALRASGAAIDQPRRVTFRVSESNVRYFHPGDAAAAEALADSIGASARDFTFYDGSLPAGTVEVWLSGDETVAATTEGAGTASAAAASLPPAAAPEAAAPTPAPAPAPAAQPQRTVRQAPAPTRSAPTSRDRELRDLKNRIILRLRRGDHL